MNLNEPNKLGDVSWVEPGKYIGIWWGMISNRWTWGTSERHGATTERAKQYIDFAAKHGFRGVLIEGWNVGWDGDWFNNGREFSFTQSYPDFDLREVTDYARSKGVRLIGHHETSGNIANYEAQLEDALDLYKELGVDWIKTGYVADAGGIVSCNSDIDDPCDPDTEIFEWHDGQRQVQHHLKVVQEAAERGIAINPHEPVKDTGLRRTYPNWVSREGARGQEYNAWNAYGSGVEHDPTLVYTRMLSGPMDYTPGVLGLVGDNDYPFSSTLGLYLAIYSPIQIAADFINSPSARAGVHQGSARGLVGKHLIDGAVGDYAIFARKGAIARTGMWAGSTMRPNASTLDFDFLDRASPTRPRSGRMDRSDLLDRESPRHRIHAVKRATATPRLAPGSGVAIQLKPLMEAGAI